MRCVTRSSLILQFILMRPAIHFLSLRQLGRSFWLTCRLKCTLGSAVICFRMGTYPLYLTCTAQ
ncbi:MAG: hypothetical protein OJF50_000013 [Nitrospira sp.]|jgi:hypothetical protein|nr:hypothetical protein [Nitrospira sp.]